MNSGITQFRKLRAGRYIFFLSNLLASEVIDMPKSLLLAVGGEEGKYDIADRIDSGYLRSPVDEGFRSPYINLAAVKEPHYSPDRPRSIQPQEMDWRNVLDGVERAYIGGEQSKESTTYSIPRIFGSNSLKVDLAVYKEIDSDLDLPALRGSLEEDGDMAYQLVADRSSKGLDVSIDLYGPFSPTKGCYRVNEHPRRRPAEIKPEYSGVFREETDTSRLPAARSNQIAA